MLEIIRRIVAENGRLPVDVNTLSDEQDLYAVGLKSFAAVQLLIALENDFEVEFPDSMLGRRNFASVRAIADCIGQLNTEGAQ